MAATVPFLTPQPSDLVRRSLASVWHPCTQMKAHDPSLGAAATPLVPICRAQGVWLYTENGGRILDGISSWWVNLFGHGHPHIKAAIHDQLDRLDHIMLAGLTHEPVVLLSEKLGQMTGLGHAFYGSDGSSATEVALKMSAHYWRNHGRAEKCRFVGLAGGYHGETVGALSVTDIDLFRTAYAPLVRLSATMTSPDARKRLEHETPADAALRAANDLEAWLQAHHHHTAALILEPMVQCAAGMAMHDASYLQHAKRLCQQYDVHLVIDEIATGFGRTGAMFAHQHAGITPDFICLSKGLTGGTLPLSVVLTTDDVYAAFYDDDVSRGFLHSHSYTGNPLACRAALATLELFDELAILQRNVHTAVAIGKALQPLDAHPQLHHARHLGMIWAWDVKDAPPQFARTYAKHALKHGLLLRPIGSTLYTMPPYVMDDEAIAHLGKGMQLALNDALSSTPLRPNASSPDAAIRLA